MWLWIKGSSLFLFLLLQSACQALRVSPEEYVALPTFQPQRPIEIALVLGGGGSKGLAHLGAIEELERSGIRPDLIIGCSAGAIAGALYADYLDVENITKRLLPLKKRDVFDYSYINPIFGIVNGEALRQLMTKLLQARTFEELKIPLIVVATDLVTGDTVEFSSGPLPAAICASCAFPGIFKPISLYGRVCIDGGATSPVPVEIARKYGARMVIAIDLSEKLPKENPKHLLGVTERSLHIAYRKFVEQALESADVAVRMNFDELGTFSDRKNEWLYEQGKQVIRSYLPEIYRKLDWLDLRAHDGEEENIPN